MNEQEQFWAGKFGNDYINRNKGADLLASNLSFFSKALKQAGKINSVIEFGANIGCNLMALELLYPNIQKYGIEINEKACEILKTVTGDQNVFNGPINDFKPRKLYDLVISKGVLIHINPDDLKKVYDKLYHSCRRYILIAEYYNPSPVTINYRGNENKLFKRDFAGEIMDLYHELKLIDYGFIYRNDPVHPQDDITYFLMEKTICDCVRNV